MRADRPFPALAARSKLVASDRHPHEEQNDEGEPR